MPSHSKLEPNLSTNMLVDERILLDLKNLNSVNSTDLINETIALFEKNLAQRLDHITKALENQNTDQALTAIHALKSAASAFGGSVVARICNAMSEDTKQNKFSEALVKAHSIPNEVQKIKNYVQEWLLAQSS